jgi:hypothetical protein
VVVVIGVDAHKKTHTLVAVDGNGRKLGEKTVQATDAGHTKALRWSLLKFGDDDLTWGIDRGAARPGTRRREYVHPAPGWLGRSVMTSRLTRTGRPPMRVREFRSLCDAVLP